MKDDVPISFNNVHSQLGKAMREHFPQTGGGYGSLSFTFTPGEAAATMLLRARQQYTMATDYSPDNNDQHIQMFRRAVLAAVPKEIKSLMEDNPEVDQLNTQTWERHLAHHLSRFNKQHTESKSEEEELRVQLLRTQLEIARKTIQIDKKNAKQLIVHPVAPAVQPQGQQNPQGGLSNQGPPYSQPHFDYVNSSWQQRGGFRGGVRGRGGFGVTPGLELIKVCFICGQPDHWFKQCSDDVGPVH